MASQNALSLSGKISEFSDSLLIGTADHNSLRKQVSISRPQYLPRIMQRASCVREAWMDGRRMMTQSGSTSISPQTAAGPPTWRSSKQLRMGRWERMILCQLSFSRRASRRLTVDGRTKPSGAGCARHRRYESWHTRAGITDRLPDDRSWVVLLSHTGER